MEGHFDVEMLALLLGCERTSELTQTPPQFLSIVFDQASFSSMPLIKWGVSKVCESAKQEGLRSSSNTTGLPISVITTLLQEQSGITPVQDNKTFARPLTSSKNFSAEFKQQVLDYYTASKNSNETARHFNLQSSQVYMWAQKYLGSDSATKRPKLGD
jgi:hypothetical protein